MTYIWKLKFRFYTRYNPPKGIVNEVIIKLLFSKKIQIFFEISQKLAH